MLTFTGERPAACAASIPSSTRASGTRVSLIELEDLLVERVEADRHAVEAGAREPLALAPRARVPLVVSAISSMPSIGASIATRRVELAAQQRLAAGQADLAHALPRDDRDDARDLLERQAAPSDRRNAVPLAEDLARHAVGAAQVAAVGDRHAQVAQRVDPSNRSQCISTIHIPRVPVRLRSGSWPRS